MNRQLKPTSQTNILLIDDTPDNLRLLAKMLELQGYVVILIGFRSVGTIQLWGVARPI
jgi:response regulator RpfG family c-di-GMP phosphodiesterase